jgi:hypothetical protein
MRRSPVRAHCDLLLASLRGCQRTSYESELLSEAAKLAGEGRYAWAIRRALRAFKSILLRTHYGTAARL